MLEADEAGRMITNVEERMKDVMERSLDLRLPEPEEVLREVNWLKGLPDILISKIVSASESKLYNEGDSIMTQVGKEMV